MYRTLGHVVVLLLNISIVVPSAEHLLLSRIVHSPSEAEMISIYNPTSENVSLANYYLSDSNEYYKIQSDDINSFSSLDFIVKFPDNASIDSDSTIHILLNSDYVDFYGDLIQPDFYFGDGIIIEPAPGLMSTKSDKLSSREMIILFYWNGSQTEPVKDIDYFIWGSSDNAVDKSGYSWGDESQVYKEDTEALEQKYYIDIHQEYFSYMRIDFEEGEELQNDGNGIGENDETSENLYNTWDIIEISEFSYGCLDNEAENYNPDANAPCNIYGSDNDCCIISLSNETSFSNIIDDYAANWEFENQEVTIRGMLVDYFDVTVYGGPHALTLQDDSGYRLECTIFPDIIQDATNNYNDYFDNIISPPFDRHLLQVTATIGDYDGELQLSISSAGNLRLLETFDSSGIYLSDIDQLGSCYTNSGVYQEYSENECAINGHNWILSDRARILPAPYPIIPSLGETLDFSYFFPENSRVIIRIYDISGRFISSLIDQYYDNSGVVIRGNDIFSYLNTSKYSSAWDGRDIHGQILSPGTYIMSIEAYNFTSGKMTKDAAPVIIGTNSNE